VARRWIKGAIKHPGALTRRAKSAGFKTARAYCGSLKNGKWHKGVSTRVKRQCNLAGTLRGLRRR